VRAALKLLRSTGLVELGAHVRRIDRTLVSELYQARLLIEPYAVGLAVAARGACPEPRAAAADLATVSQANRRFHQLLHTQWGNRFLAGQLDQLQDITALAATEGWRHGRTDREEAAEHVRILAAYEQGDAPQAAELMRLHIETALAHILQLPTQDQPGG
jgi:DNA-binding GntR family transcriptional regulator